MGLRVALAAVIAVAVAAAGTGEGVRHNRRHQSEIGETAVLLERGGEPDAAPPGADGAPAPAVKATTDECDVCTYVLANKANLQPYLCRGLREPAQQMAVRVCGWRAGSGQLALCRARAKCCIARATPSQCVKVLLSLMWWLPSETYWINYGCQRQSGGQWAWVRPCPPHIICSWLKSLDSGNEKPFCPESPDYRKPQ